MKSPRNEEQSGRPHVVIIGGGFGGLNAAQGLRDAPVDVTLIDRRNFHLFQPLLYQVATGSLSPGDISSPLRVVFRKQNNCCVRLGEVRDIDVHGQSLELDDGERVSFDYLVLAAGSTFSYFGHDEWAAIAPGLKAVEDATEMRRKIFAAFERAEFSTDEQERRRNLTFVCVGGGPTGVELAGAIAEIARDSMKNDFRNIDPRESRIVVIEAQDQILAAYPESLALKAERDLERLGASVVKGGLVTEVTEDFVVYKTKDEAEHRIETKTVLWTAGVKPSPLTQAVVEATGAETARGGQIKVTSHVHVKGHPNIFPIGDVAYCEDAEGKVVPWIAPGAIQEGKYVAGLIADRVAGRAGEPFQYKDYGKMAVVGRKSAVAVLWGRNFSGTFAWILWALVHVLQLVQFQNRLLVSIQWIWSYVTFGRTARLITGNGYTAKPAAKEREKIPA